MLGPALFLVALGELRSVIRLPLHGQAGMRVPSLGRDCLLLLCVALGTADYPSAQIRLPPRRERLRDYRPLA